MISNELLKKKILDEAIHGKLVENDCNLKKSEVKENPEIALFDIPANWLWTELNNACQLSNSEKVKDVNLPYLDVKYLRTRGEKVFKNSGAILNCGDYIILVDGENSGEVFISPEKGIMGSTFKKLLFNDKINNKYIRLLLKYYQETLKNNKTGSAIPHLNKKMFSWLPVPIPPIEEQERIVKKIEKLFELIDKKEKNDKDKEKLKTLLKEKILDSAIRGELVENDLSLPAVDVEGIKDDVPFEIPDNWEWSKVKNITNNIQYGYTASAMEEGNAKLLRITDIQDGKINWQDVPFCDIDESIRENYILNKNDIVVARTGGTVGKNFMMDEIENSVFASYLIRLIPSNNIYPKYLKYYMDTSYYWKQIWDNAKGMAQPGVNSKTLANMFIPIPPLEQQRKIVDKIEKCFELIEQL